LRQVSGPTVVTDKNECDSADTIPIQYANVFVEVDSAAAILLP
jgi:hypothetical protein